MSNFFVDKKVYKDRLDICKKCTNYFKPTGTCKKCGCFMRIKASIGVMECPDLLWKKEGVTKKIDEVPKHLMKEVREVWEGIKSGKAESVEMKKRAVQLYNTIYSTNYKLTTSCGSCLNTVKEGFRELIKTQENEQ